MAQYWTSLQQNCNQTQWKDGELSVVKPGRHHCYKSTSWAIGWFDLEYPGWCMLIQHHFCYISTKNAWLPSGHEEIEDGPGPYRMKGP